MEDGVLKIEIRITTNQTITYFNINHPTRFTYFINDGEMFVNDFNYNNIRIPNNISRRVLIKKVGHLINLWEQRNKIFQEEINKLK